MENDIVAFQYEEIPKEVEETLNKMNMEGGGKNENKKRVGS